MTAANRPDCAGAVLTVRLPMASGAMPDLHVLPANGGEVGRPRSLKTGETGIGKDGVAAPRVMRGSDSPDQPFALQALCHAGHAAEGHLAGGGEFVHAHLPVGGLGQVHQRRVFGEGEPLLADHVCVDGTGQRAHGAGEAPDECFFVPIEGL